MPTQYFFLNKNSFAIHCTLMSIAHRPSALIFVLFGVFAWVMMRLLLVRAALCH